jgi:hypothetical protein
LIIVVVVVVLVEVWSFPYLRFVGERREGGGASAEEADGWWVDLFF